MALVNSSNHPRSNPPDDESAELEASKLAARLQNGEFPVAVAPDPLAHGDICHFVAPVRFGRRRADQYGHLVLTAGWLKFRGTQDMSVTWDELADAQRAGREIVVSFAGSRRLLRFACHSAAEAARGAVIARYLTLGTQVRATDVQPGHHAAV
jgi:hypothetical protein